MADDTTPEAPADAAADTTPADTSLVDPAAAADLSAPASDEPTPDEPAPGTITDSDPSSDGVGTPSAPEGANGDLDAAEAEIDAHKAAEQPDVATSSAEAQPTTPPDVIGNEVAQPEAPELEHVDADDLLGDLPDEVSHVVVTDGSGQVPLQGAVTFGQDPNDNESKTRVVAAAAAAPTGYSNYADGESSGFEHPDDTRDNRMYPIPGSAMPPGAGVGVPADLRLRQEALIEADEADVHEDRAALDEDEAQLAADEEAIAAENAAYAPIQGNDVSTPAPAPVTSSSSTPAAPEAQS